jgi:uncharacterized protein (TIGR03790 family)
MKRKYRSTPYPSWRPSIETIAVHFRLCAILFLFLCLPRPSFALEPHEILVVANKNAAQSATLARYYMSKRNIPPENLLALWVTDKERCSRREYENRVAAPVRSFLQEKDPQRARFRCLLIMYGVPLAVAAPDPIPEEKAELAVQRERIRNLRLKADEAKKDSGTGAKERLEALNKEIKELQDRITALSKSDQASSLDSEIALVLNGPYSLSGWTPNPMFVGFRGKKIDNMPAGALMVSRLDGTSDKIVRRVIDDSLAVEEKGLEGTAYIDARWPDPGRKELSGYAFYDASLHRAAERILQSGRMLAIVDDKGRLFQPGECPNAALYCGWYSLGNYVDAFTWTKGAVGFHIASQECQTLKQDSSRVWCKMMLEKGVAVTIGPVNEPYVQAFPLPEVFFGLLTEGKLTLAECYASSLPFLSWQMVLIGDPLYRPFKACPADALKLKGPGPG